MSTDPCDPQCLPPMLGGPRVLSPRRWIPAAHTHMVRLSSRGFWAAARS